MMTPCCAVEGCEKPVLARGWCYTHYRRFRLYGDPLHVPEPINQNTNKTHCDHGHEFTPENTYLRKDGRRLCRACRRENLKKHRAKQEDAS